MEDLFKSYGPAIVSIAGLLTNVAVIVWKGGALSSRLVSVDNSLKDLKTEFRKDHDVLVDLNTSVRFIREDLGKLDAELTTVKRDVAVIRIEIVKIDAELKGRKA